MRDIMEDIRENAIMVGTIAFPMVWPSKPETYANSTINVLAEVLVVVN